MVAAIGDRLGCSGPAGVDVVVGEGDIARLRETVEKFPVASATLAVLLRYSGELSDEGALAAESATYSTLQAGAEFSRWKAYTEVVLDHGEAPAVDVRRTDDEMIITLHRPHRHNAINRQMRDELCTAIRVALADTTIHHITLLGSGQSFCSGGDLAEFGTRSNPATAHALRLAQSPSHLLNQVRNRTTARIHGFTLGGGIELAAFARHVVADEGTTIGLPEIRMGLIPGAGGTLSLTRRCGRQRVAALALATDTIEASTAKSWGLVDEIST